MCFAAAAHMVAWKVGTPNGVRPSGPRLYDGFSAMSEGPGFGMAGCREANEPIRCAAATTTGNVRSDAIIVRQTSKRSLAESETVRRVGRSRRQPGGGAPRAVRAAR